MGITSTKTLLSCYFHHKAYMHIVSPACWKDMKEYFPFSKGLEVLNGGHSDIFSLKDLLLNWSVCTVMGLCPTHC